MVVDQALDSNVLSQKFPVDKEMQGEYLDTVALR